MGEGFKFKYRYVALFALFMVWIVSYMDRMVMATAIPYIAKEFNLTPVSVGVVLSSFFFGYATFQVIGGILADKFGARKVMTFGIFWWSLFTAFTGMVNNLFNMIWVRAVFGMGEGIAPAATWKACAIWSPAKQRAVTSGLMLCSNALGPALAPLFVAAVMASIGWRGVFYTLTIPGLLLAAWIWFNLPDNPADKKGISQEELDELKEDIPMGPAKTGEVKMSFWQIMRQEAVWKSFFILFFNNMVAWGFASWLPSFLVQARNLSLSQMGVAASLPYFAGTVGWVLGGWLSDTIFKHNRKLPLIAAQWLTAICLYMVYNADSLQSLVIWQTITGFILYIAVGGVFSLPVSAISKEITGRAMGIVNTAGQAAGFLSPLIVGFLVQMSGGGAKSFDTAFIFFIICVLISSFFAMLFPKSRVS
ncbi:MAG: MFS transporter [Negativicutes bacterium]|nr:MFS transporter [Negativicutes bacterium]